MNTNTGSFIMRVSGKFLVLPLLLIVFCPCFVWGAADNATARANVFVSILPQAYFVERVGGSRVEVHVLVGPGQSPHSYEPTPKQMTMLTAADIYFKIGLPFEDRLFNKIMGITKKILIADTSRGIKLRPLEEAGEDAHERGRHDPHIWLDPMLIAVQADIICDALCARDPLHADDYRKNLRQFRADLNALDAEIRKKLEPFRGRELFVFHPAFGYFADAYGLTQVAIETAGKEPGSKSLAAVLDRAKKSGAKVIFAERQFSPKSAEAVARQIGAGVVSLDPLARDCFQNFTFITDQIVSSFSQQGQRHGQ